MDSGDEQLEMDEYAEEEHVVFQPEVGGYGAEEQLSDFEDPLDEEQHSEYLEVIEEVEEIKEAVETKEKP